MGLRIFIVEASIHRRETLLAALGAIERVEVVGCASSERDAIHWLASYPSDWDVVLVDLMLADGSALNVIRECRHRRPDQLVVLLTEGEPVEQMDAALERADAIRVSSRAFH